MSDPVELQSYIRFQLGELRAVNGDHKFEEMCFHLARRVVTSELLPGTGPVGAGGDQGRDFETFRGRLGDEDLSFACTLQVDDLKRKIRADVASATSKGENVDAVYAMVEGDLPVGRRHELQEEMRDKHGIRLEVFDGQAIATHLADAENFWIARRFLDVPESFAPDGRQGTTEYVASKRRWTDQDKILGTFGDLEDVSESARSIVFGDGPKGDLEFWLERLRPAARPDGARLERTAFYQLAVLSWRGTETLYGLEEDLATYFDLIPELTGTGDLEDAEVMLSYVATAHNAGHVRLDGPAVVGWRESLLERLEDQVEKAGSSQRGCALRMTLGAAHLVPAGREISPSAVDAAVEAWTQLLDLAEMVPFFAMGRLAKLVGAISPFLVDHPGYAGLVESLETQIATRPELSSLTSTRRDRALQLFKNERPLEALEEFHRVRVAWFVADTLRGSVLTALLMARCYERLHLHLAAKFHALAAAGVALQSPVPDALDLAAKGLLMASRYDYESGYWLGAVELTEVGILLYDEFHRAPWEEDDDERDSTFFHLKVPHDMASRFLPAAVPAIAATLERTGLAASFGGTGGPWPDLGEGEIADEIVAQVGSAPFVDCGAERTIAWSALGLRWRVTFENAYETALAAERFVAMSQVVAAHLSKEDLCFLPTDIEVHVSATGLASSTNLVMMDDGPVWQINLARGSGDDAPPASEVQVDTLSTIVEIVMSYATIPTEAADAIVAGLVDAGLFAKIGPGGTYDEFYSMVVSKERWDESGRAHCRPLAHRQAEARLPAPELAWTDAPGPTYSREKAEEFLANRYRNLEAATSLTVGRLMEESAFRTTVVRLRDEGLLDWHILNAVNSVAGHYRARLESDSEEAFVEATKRWLWCVEDADAPEVPVSEFTLENLREAHRATSLNSLQTWGLEYHQPYVDAEAVELFLSERYRHRLDDIPHDDPFALGMTEAAQDP